VIEIHGNAKSRGEGGKDLGLPALSASSRHRPLSTFHILNDDLPQEVSYVFIKFGRIKRT
jgi:hypothetical protein